MIDEAYQLVELFQRSANQPVSPNPVKLTKQRVAIRTKWMLEEIEEFISANDIYSQADALTDLLYYLLGTYVEMGIKPDALFSIVHRSNMMKIESSEGLIKDEDGKVQKPSSWSHPDICIKELIDNLQNTAT